MKKILVPVDFSENALAAARYAATVAQHYGWSVHLLHAYLPFSSSFADEQFNKDIFAHKTSEALADMQPFEAQLAAEFPQLPLDSSCKDGLLGKVLPSLVKEDGYGLVVMGTKGASGLKHVILGSNTFEIIKKSPAPIIAIPNDDVHFSNESCGLLTNFKPAEIDALSTYITLFGTPTKLVLLHFSEKSDARSEQVLDDWAKTIASETGIAQVKYISERLVGRVDVREELPDYIFNHAESAGISNLLVTKERKNFLNSLFSRCLVRSIAHQLKMPVYFHNAERL